MERWERYAHGRSGSGRPEHTRADRVKNIIIILLAVALLGVGIAGGQAMALRSKTQDLILARAMTECGSAVNYVNSMSRSGGSDTAGVLGKVRANVNAIDVLSGLSQSLYGWQLAPESVFSELYSVIDSYSAKLRNGTSAIDELTRLGDSLTNLQQLLTSAQ